MRLFVLVIALALGVPSPRAVAQESKSERVWFVAVDNVQQGPMTAGDVEKLVKQGKVKGDSLVWREGRPDWVPFTECPEFRAFFVKPPPLPGGAAGAPPPLPGGPPERTIVGGIRGTIRRIPPAPIDEPAPPPRPRPPVDDAELKQKRALHGARERAAIAGDSVRNTGLIWGATTVALGGAGTMALLFASASGDSTTTPACTILGCGLCIACGGTALTGTVLEGLAVVEMVDADQDLEQTEKAARASGMRY